MMTKTMLAIVLWASASTATATMLRYDFEFEASALISESETYVLEGAGVLFADTELDSVIGGRLESADIICSWYDPSPSALQFRQNYYGADYLTAERARAVNELTGESGYIDLGFLLWPGGGAPYVERLDSNQQIDNWSELYFPSADPDDSPWLNQSLKTDLYIEPPTRVGRMPLNVPEPSSLGLLILSLLALGWQRFTREERVTG